MPSWEVHKELLNRKPTRNASCFTLLLSHLCMLHSSSGNYMWLGHHWSNGYGAFSSPPIFKENNYCSLEFYFRFWAGSYGRASLSVYIEEFKENITTLLWSTSELTTYWKKTVIKLPQTSSNYSVVFFGYFESNAIVLVDDTEFLRCNLCKLIHFSYEGRGPLAMFTIISRKGTVITLWEDWLRKN